MILGARGLIGQSFVMALRDQGRVVKALARSDAEAPFDLSNPWPTLLTMQEWHPDLVILAAAYAHVDGCEVDPDLSYRVNVTGSLAILLRAIDLGATTVWFSSDYVFDGSKGPYLEEALPSPINVYGQHKHLVEETLFRKVSTKCLVIRTTGVYGPEQGRKNFALRLLDQVRGKQTSIPVPYDQVSTPTYAPDLAAATLALVDAGECGVWNVAGSDVIARDSFARRILAAFDLPQEAIEPVPTQALEQRARRPLAGGLTCGRLTRATRHVPLGVEEGLRRLHLWEEGVSWA